MKNGNATKADYDSLLDKLTDFAGMLSSGEQYAFANVLRGGAIGENGMSKEAWDGLLGVVATNSAGIDRS